ncbi:MAG: PAS domain-containing protein [Treponema sp.]|nr:PAS domain-containing protein [Treponema sp.]
MLDSYKTSLDGLGAYLGEVFEFVLHDLSNLEYSVIKIINGYHSSRKEGASITDLALSMLEQINANNIAPISTTSRRASMAGQLNKVPLPSLGRTSA